MIRKKTQEQIRASIEEGRTALGIELGSTRIKAALIDETYETVASGSSEWENRLEGGIWTYGLDEVWKGLRESYREMAEQVKRQYGVPLRKIGAIGFSAMMHGYLAFNSRQELLVPFRTWRNSTTQQASEELTELFHYHVPQRYSIAHLYQAILDGEPHVGEIDYLTTLAGYVHWKLSGRKALGIGDASGMFPIDTKMRGYHKTMIHKFNALVEEKGFPWKLEDILPSVLPAGCSAGRLSEEGARLLDPTGVLQAGIMLAPPEGDAQTGMMATNSIAERTGNVSAGTSVFAIIILERELSRVYPEIDLVTTPEGRLAANVHVNNGTSDLNAWVGLFEEFAKCLQAEETDRGRLFEILCKKALEGDADCGGLLSYGYYSGETIMKVPQGRPLFLRTPQSRFDLANFMRAHLYTSLAALKTGVGILQKEHVKIDSLTGHGGLFKTEGVAQRFLAAALNAPVTVMETAGEGGAWGMALLAFYLLEGGGASLEDYLQKVFRDTEKTVEQPEAEEVKGFEAYTKRYQKAIDVERAAAEAMPDESARS